MGFVVRHRRRPAIRRHLGVSKVGGRRRRRGRRRGRRRVPVLIS